MGGGEIFGDDEISLPNIYYNQNCPTGSCAAGIAKDQSHADMLCLRGGA